MRGRLAAISLVVAGLLSSPVPASAHHGAAAFETSKTITMKATVTDWFWANPHCFVKFDYKNDKGEVEHWVAETTNPAMLNRVGWTKETLKAGDQVTLYVNPNKVGAKITFLQKVVFPDGKELSTAKAF